MDVIQGEICRLCLKIGDSGLKVIEEATQEMFQYLQLDVDLTVSSAPAICENCLKDLKKCIDFKEKYIHSISSEVSFKRKNNGMDNIADGNSMCHFCQQLTKCRNFNILNNGGADMNVLFQKYLPVMDSAFTKELITCTLCYELLQLYFSLITSCLKVEEKFKKYCKVEGTNDKGGVELNKVHFLLKDELKNKCGDNSLYSSKIKTECFDDGGSKNVKDEVGDKNFIEIEEKNLCVKEETMEVKAEQGSCESFPDDTLLLYPTTTLSVANEETCENYLALHLQTQANTSEMPTYNCKICQFKSRHRSALARHSQIHKHPSELTMHKCDVCTYQTRQKGVLEIHMLTHKSTSEVMMHKCEACDFQTKYKGNLQKHTLIHKTTSEIKLHECEICGFKSKRNKSLLRHLLTHKSTSEVAVFKCEMCAHQTRHKSALKEHMVTHKTTAEITAYKCDVCLYRAKRKDILHQHMLSHKNLSEVPIYKCEMCAHQTKYKSNLHKHALTHKSTSEVTVYKCEVCVYETKRKGNLRQHLLAHKNPSEVTMYQCEMCAYKTKYRSNICQHMVVHKNKLK